MVPISAIPIILIEHCAGGVVMNCRTIPDRAARALLRTTASASDIVGPPDETLEAEVVDFGTPEFERERSFRKLWISSRVPPFQATGPLAWKSPSSIYLTHSTGLAVRTSAGALAADGWPRQASNGACTRTRRSAGSQAGSSGFAIARCLRCGTRTTRLKPFFELIQQFPIARRPLPRCSRASSRLPDGRGRRGGCGRMRKAAVSAV